MSRISADTLELIELEYLSKQAFPLWGGHFKRGEPANDSLLDYMRRGLIEAVGEQGYVITEKGREYVKANLTTHKLERCPHCGRAMPLTPARQG